MKNRMKCATWNVRNLYRAGHAAVVEEEAIRYGVEIMALQEVMWPQQGECTLNRGTILYSGRSDGTHRQGVAVYLSHRARRALLRFNAVNERILKIRL